MGTISNAIPTKEYQPLLDGVQVAQDICTNLGEPPQDQEVGGYALAVLARWASNVQAFIVLRNARLLADAYAIARVGSELAITAKWIECGVHDRFTSRTARLRAVNENGNYRTRVWLDGIHGRFPTAPRLYDPTTEQGRILGTAKKQDLPGLEAMARCCEITKDLYAFAYRGESGAVHSTGRVLVANGDGKPPLRESFMLHSVLVSSLAVFEAASVLTGDRRADLMTVYLQGAVHEHARQPRASDE